MTRRLRGARGPRSKGTALLLLCVSMLRCGRDTPTSPAIPPFGPPASSHVLVGAGDIAVCGSSGTEDTATLLDSIDGTVFTTGDNAYFTGSRQDFRDCYDPTWGRHKDRTRPTPGNHEYEHPGAAPYFEYFGESAGPDFLGYYSYMVGEWQVLALNSNIASGSGSAQGLWLRTELAAGARRCTVAYWHHALFSSGPNGDAPQMRDIFRILHDAGAEIVIAGHEHSYERFARQTADGVADPVRGIRQFVVGTGGASLSQFPTIRPNSEVRLSAHGVLKLTLAPGTFTWEFITLSGTRDSGGGSCR
ncbi:MAG TPA: metallophosphoesterase [Vicinamibacterales bacterium]|nr:metallophosphoesterase [Vicinamibacterales bacterium]